jgi:hypothetical protein
MKEDLKKELHQLIDKIEDEHVLNMLKEDAVAYASEKDIIDELTPEQLEELNEAIAEADSGEDLLEWSDFKKQMESWSKK